ncbi:putative jacalin-like lectin domain-containing protein [Helianthus annuus]|nr:putative jacalin-like lectin domain-containing protein [Helianthus annuus]
MEATSDIEGCITHRLGGGGFDYYGYKPWVYRPKGFTKKIKISVRHECVVHSINFQTYLITGETVSSFFGGKGGNRTDTICIDYPDEYLKLVRVTMCHHDGTYVVQSICFTTNQNCYGLFGKTKYDSVYASDHIRGMIVGFHGYASTYLNAIGVYVMPESLALRPIEDEVMLEPCSSMSRITMPRDAGPWGAGGGKPWDDGIFSTIKQIRVHEGELNVIYALQFEFLKKNGNTVSHIHGGTNGVKNIQLVNLDDKDEYLISISEFYGPVKGSDGLEAIASISFHTNKKTHGPFGDERGIRYTCDSSTALPGKVVGFHGRSNGFLSAIGVHMEYF